MVISITLLIRIKKFYDFIDDEKQQNKNYYTTDYKIMLHI